MFCVRTAAFCVLLCCLLASCGGAKTDASVAPPLSFSLELDGAQEPISCYYADDGSCVVFLPSCAQMDKLSVSLPDTVDAKLGDAVLRDGATCGAFTPGTDYALTVGQTQAHLRFMRAKNVPALFVHTRTGDMDLVHAQKTNREAVQLLLTTQEGEIAYRSAGTDEMRGRGNSTWSKDKKPYNLYLHESVDLLGMGASTDWVLLANAFDESNLRNRVICEFAQRVSPYAQFAPDTAYTDVYLNGEYAGLYLLSEKTQIAENRLDIAPDSMLFSWVLTDRNDTHFALTPSICVEIESPKKCTNDRLYALQTKLLAWQDALENGGDWQSFVDTDSFARKYLIEECFLNYDIINSQYFYLEPGGKLTAGPCWDYDLTLGISWRNTWSTPNTLSVQNRQDAYETWYSLLWKQDMFRTRVRTLFRTEFLPLLEELAGSGIEREAQRIAPSSAMNALRWKGLFGGKTAAEAVRETAQFLTRRVAFLRSVWVDGTRYCTVELRHPVKYEYISVLPNTVCTEFPQPQQLDLPADTVWLREDTGAPFDPGSVITEDVTLVLPAQPKKIGLRTLAVFAALAAMAGLVVVTVVFEHLQKQKTIGKYKKR